VATPAALTSDLAVLVQDFLGDLHPNTVAAYRSDLAGFEAWARIQLDGPGLQRFVVAPLGEQNLALHRFRAHLTGRHLAPATVNRHLAAVRSLLDFLHRVGVMQTLPRVRGVRSRPYRDTRAIGTAEVRALLGAATAQENPAQSARNVALIHLLFGLGLRVSEAVSLRLLDVDLGGSRLSILGKQRRERDWLTLPGPCRDALAEWLTWRGPAPSETPLFIRLDGRRPYGHLTRRSAHRTIHDLGVSAGLGPHIHPHQLRHAAITSALDLGLPFRTVIRFARHAKPETTMIYDDSRADHAGQAAEAVAGSLTCNASHNSSRT
jgi:integrase/recombinase XerC